MRHATHVNGHCGSTERRYVVHMQRCPDSQDVAVNFLIKACAEMQLSATAGIQRSRQGWSGRVIVHV